MDLRGALLGVAPYNHPEDKGQSAQLHLRELYSHPPDTVPLGLKLRVSGSGFSLPTIPWIALLDPDVTSTATDGLYLVYLFTSDVSRVYLSMNQGVTQHRKRAEEAGHKNRAAEVEAVQRTRVETKAIRESLDASLLTHLDETIDLGAGGYLPAGYEAGNIAAASYDLNALPSDADLAADLQGFALLYQASVAAKRELASTGQIATSAVSEAKSTEKSAPSPVFAPKDDSDYLANVVKTQQKRSRRHETLVKAFGEAVQAAGGTPATNVHPRDLTVDAGGEHWLVEAKTVGLNAELAVREAIGQLYSYRHFYYRRQGMDDPRILALFNGPVGGALTDLLQSLSIEALCRARRQLGGHEGGGGTRSAARWNSDHVIDLSRSADY